jgi:dihydrofolate synthase/folylpolyglutamate synthase
VFGAREMPRSVQAAAVELRNDVQQLGRDFEWQASPEAWSWKGRDQRYDALPHPGLQGTVQFDNASTALAALACLAERLPVSRKAVERALQTVELPGRFQILECGVEWVLDVAHNPAAARTLARQLRTRPGVPRTIAVCGVLGDKDLEGICAELHTSIDAWIVAGLDSPRALTEEALGQRLRRAGANVVAERSDVASACACATELAGATGRVVVFGSFLTVGPALAWLRPRCVTFA